MTLLDDVLRANAAVADGLDVPVPPVPHGRRLVVVTCSEIRAPGGADISRAFGLAADEVFLVANAGARVHDAAGDVARSVAAALAEMRGEVFVVAHEDCSFLDADAESVAALVASPNSTLLSAAETLCGQSFISARSLAIASAETLRASPFAGTAPVHALVLSDGRGRLAAEQAGYGASAAAAGLVSASPSMSASPSPILAAPGGPSGFVPGPVSLFGANSSPLMGAVPPLMAPPPDLGAVPPSFVPPPSMPVPAAFAAPEPPRPREPEPPLPPAPRPEMPTTFAEAVSPVITFDEPAREPPPPRIRTGPPKPPDVDDPFRRATETLERLRRQRRGR